MRDYHKVFKQIKGLKKKVKTRHKGVMQMGRGITKKPRILKTVDKPLACSILYYSQQEVVMSIKSPSKICPSFTEGIFKETSSVGPLVGNDRGEAYLGPDGFSVRYEPLVY